MSGSGQSKPLRGAHKTKRLFLRRLIPIRWQRSILAEIQKWQVSVRRVPAVFDGEKKANPNKHAKVLEKPHFEARLWYNAIRKSKESFGAGAINPFILQGKSTTPT